MVTPSLRSVALAPLLVAACLLIAVLSAAPLAAQRKVYVANANADSVTVYESTVGGNQAPAQEITRSPSAMDLASSVAVDAGRQEIFVAVRFQDAVAVFDLAADGPTVPLRVLEGAATTIDTAWDIELDHERGELYVLSKDASQILVFPITASGNVAPTRTIETAVPWGTDTLDFDLDLVHDEIVLADRTPGAIAVRFFALDADGTVEPLRSITGPATGITLGGMVAVDPIHDEVFVRSTNSSIRVFPRTASGDVAPLRTLSGASTGFGASAGGLDVDPVLGELAVLRSNPDDAILIFGRTANGNTVPLRTLAGGATQLNGPSQLAYFPSLVFGDGFERGDSSGWGFTTP
jgi:hypothetical protein